MEGPSEPGEERCFFEKENSDIIVGVFGNSSPAFAGLVRLENINRLPEDINVSPQTHVLTRESGNDAVQTLNTKLDQS